MEKPTVVAVVLVPPEVVVPEVPLNEVAEVVVDVVVVIPVLLDVAFGAFVFALLDTFAVVTVGAFTAFTFVT